MKARHILTAVVWVLCAGLVALLATGRLSASPETRIRNAQILASRRRLEQAESILRSTVSSHPDHALAHLNLSQILLRRRAFLDALASYRRALMADPLLISSADFEDYVEAAADAEQRHAFLRAYVEVARQAAAGSARPMHVAAFDLAARVQFREFRIALQKATAGFTQLAGVRGRLAAAIGALETRRDANGTAEELARQLAAAKSMFESAIELDASFIPARLGLAMMNIETGAVEEGLRAVVDIVDGYQDPPANLLLFAADLLARNGRIRSAERFVERLIEKEPDSLPARYLQAAALFTKSEFEGVRPIIKRLRRNNSSDARGMFLEGSIDLVNGRYSEAARQLSMASGKYGEWELLLYHLGLAQYRVGNSSQAEKSLRELCELGGAFPEARIARAAAALTGNRLATAKETCEQVLKERPDDPDALRLLAAAQIGQNDAQGAAETLRRLVDVRPQSPLAIQALAAARLALGEHEAVIAEHEARVEAAASPGVHHRILALAYSLDGRSDVAEKHYRSLLEEDPSLPEPWLFRARALALQGRARAAVDECRLALARGASAPAMLFARGVLNTILGRHYEAREELAVGAHPLSNGTLIVNVYFALASHTDYAAAAAEILMADPFSARSQGLLVAACSAGLRGAMPRAYLDAMVHEQPGLLEVLNKAVILRHQEATDFCRLKLIDLDSMWPRLVEVYKRHPVDWL